MGLGSSSMPADAAGRAGRRRRAGAADLAASTGGCGSCPAATSTAARTARPPPARGGGGDRLPTPQRRARPGDTAAAATRARITDGFAELHHEREQVCPAWTPPPRPACSPPSTWRCCGTNPPGRPPSGSRSPTLLCGPSPVFSTQPSTDTVALPTPPPAKTPTWRICSSPGGASNLP
jgi:hypothetical protein